MKCVLTVFTWFQVKASVALESIMLLAGKLLMLLFFFFNDTATTEIYTLSLHDALPICGFLTASKQFRHGATSKSRSNTASNSTKHKSPHLSGWRQIISLIT